MGATSIARIQKVSFEDVKMARNGANFSADEKTLKSRTKTSSEDRSYTSKLKNTDIIKFFINYGYINHEKFQDEAKKDFIRVSCENFDVIFSDNDIAVNCYPEFMSTSSKFNFSEFEKYCKAIDVNPEQAISDIIINDLMVSKFPSYAEHRNKVKDDRAVAAFVALPRNMRHLVKSVQEKTTAVNKLEGNKGKYGSFDLENYSSNPHGEGTNN